VFTCAALFALQLTPELAEAAGKRPRRGRQRPRVAAPRPAPKLVPSVVPIPDDPPPPRPTDWAWHQVLATPRPGSRLTSVGTDPGDSRRVFVGTEAGTIMRSSDGGQSWDEIQLLPRVLEARVLQPSRAPTATDANPGPGLNLVFSPPDFGANQAANANAGGRPGAGNALFDPIFVGLRTDFFFFNLLTPPPVVNLLQNAVGVIAPGQSPVVSVAVCPDAVYDVYATTPRELFGSSDSGASFVPIYSVPADTVLGEVRCQGAGELILNTSQGVLFSPNGGLSLQDLVGPASSIAFGNPASGARIWIAAGTSVGAGGSLSGIAEVYTDAADVRSVAVGPSGTVWASTLEGLRVKPAGSKDWNQVVVDARGANVATKVLVGPTASGTGERVTLITRERALASDDGGRTWELFFNAGTRRRLISLAASTPGGREPRWWIVAGGELWSTVVPGFTPHPISPAVVAWAQERLRRTPSLSATLDRALFRARLTNTQVARLFKGFRGRSWLPVVNVQVGVAGPQFTDFQDQRVFTNANQTQNQVGAVLGVSVFGTWFLPDGVFSNDELGGKREALYALRRDISFVVEDAWHERVLQLQRIVHGAKADTAIAPTRARIESLDALLEAFLGEPLER
jgi:hypothetical protein